MWHQDYRNFRETTIFMMTGLELFQKTKYGDTFPVLHLILLDKSNSVTSYLVRALTHKSLVLYITSGIQYM